MMRILGKDGMSSGYKGDNGGFAGPDVISADFCFVPLAGFGQSEASGWRSPRRGVLETESRDQGRHRNAIGGPLWDRFESFVMYDVHKLCCRLGNFFLLTSDRIASSRWGSHRHLVETINMGISVTRSFLRQLP
jgi:hypothetical protein